MSDLGRSVKTGTNTDGGALRRLQELRDETRVRIHLGGMELRDAFEKIEREADHLVAQAQPVATRALNDLAARLRRIAHALDGKQSS